MKEKWQKLQTRVATLFSEVWNNVRETPRSGAIKGNGDIITPYFLIECKQRTKKNIVIEQEVWDKIKSEANLLERYPAIVSENISGEMLITLDLKDFIEFVLVIRNRNYN